MGLTSGLGRRTQSTTFISIARESLCLQPRPRGGHRTPFGHLARLWFGDLCDLCLSTGVDTGVYTAHFLRVVMLFGSLCDFHSPYPTPIRSSVDRPLLVSAPRSGRPPLASISTGLYGTRHPSRSYAVHYMPRVHFVRTERCAQSEY